MIIDSMDRLGYYLVGNKKFHSKTLALFEQKKTKEKLRWIFNNDIFDSINWAIPIDTPLCDLYKKRALQLRNKYDYLVLYFSGGADSLNVLLSFINNNIFLDEIVMQFPEPVEKNFNEADKTNKNLYSEIKYQAIPSLNKLKNKIHPNTKIRYQDISKPLLELLSYDNWTDKISIGTNISPAGIARQISQLQEPHILELCYSNKKIAQILGVDKPLVMCNEKGEYFAYFSDVNAMHSPPIDSTCKEIFQNRYQTEFFYWTPDVPEIVIKQAQLIKEACEKDRYKKLLIMQSMKKHIQNFRYVLHNIIYSNEVIVTWDPEKPSSMVVRPMDSWLWDPVNIKQINHYMAVIDHLNKNINEEFMINYHIHCGLSATYSNFYKL